MRPKSFIVWKQVVTEIKLPKGTISYSDLAMDNFGHGQPWSGVHIKVGVNNEIEKEVPTFLSK